MEVITSTQKNETEYSVEYEFNGDFTKLISAIPFDLNGPVCETICLTYDRRFLYINTLNRFEQPEFAKALIIYLN